MRLYLCGPIGADPDGYRDAFAYAAAWLRNAGFFVIDPTRAEIPDGTWPDYMRRGITDLMRCDGVALLDGWARGRGTHIEHGLALDLGIPAKPFREW